MLFKSLHRACLVLLACSLAGCSLFRFGTDQGPNSLTLENQMTRERMTLDYRKPDGEIDLGAWQQASYIMRDPRSPEGPMIDPALLDFMAALRNRLGLPPQAVIVITSGYRSPTTNAELQRRSRHAADNSYHVRGMAADIKIPGVPGAKVAEAALALKRGGVAYYPNNEHVHLDTGPVRTWSTR